MEGKQQQLMANGGRQAAVTKPSPSTNAAAAAREREVEAGNYSSALVPAVVAEEGRTLLILVLVLVQGCSSRGSLGSGGCRARRGGVLGRGIPVVEAAGGRGESGSGLDHGLGR